MPKFLLFCVNFWRHFYIEKSLLTGIIIVTVCFGFLKNIYNLKSLFYIEKSFVNAFIVCYYVVFLRHF